MIFFWVILHEWQTAGSKHHTGTRLYFTNMKWNPQAWDDVRGYENPLNVNRQQLFMLISACDFTTHLHKASNKHYVCMPDPQFAQHHCDSLQRHRTSVVKLAAVIKRMFSFTVLYCFHKFLPIITSSRHCKDLKRQITICEDSRQ